MFGLTKVEKIKRNISVKGYFEALGVEFSASGDGYVGKCPFHEDDTPSLRVTPEKELWNCFGCDKGGDVITAHELTKRMSNKEAIEDLHKLNGHTLEVISKVHQQAIKKESLLNDVQRIFHRNFLKSNEAQLYLEHRGLKNKGLWKKFEFGYSDGHSLKKTVENDEGLRRSLFELGLLNQSGNECFYKCVVFPLKDEEGNVKGFYGRSVEGHRQVYLKGVRQGLFNAGVARHNETLLITESIIDAVSLLELGYENVLPIYGTNGFTTDHLSFISKHNFKEIVFCLDNDDSGREATKQLKEKLSSLIARLSTVQLPDGIKDINEYITNNGTKEEFENLLSSRKIFFEKESKALKENKVNDESKIKESSEPSTNNNTFNFEDITYKVKGFKGYNEESMKVVLTAEKGEQRFMDRLDLYLSKSRVSFSISVSEKLSVSQSHAEDALLKIIERLEASEENSSQTKEEKSLSSTEKREALTFLKRPDLMERIVQDISACGYVGQEKAKQLLYLSATSRILQRPIHVSIRSTSSSGKSELMEKVASLFPDEAVELYSRISAQSLYYMNSLKHKLLILDEKSGAEEGAEIALRSLMSRHKLTLAVVQRDAQNGVSKTVNIEVEGPCTVWDSSTDCASEDNQNRVFELWLTESREQTRLIHQAQKQAFTLEGHKRRNKLDKIRRIHRNAQRLLKPLEVVIPFSKLIEFPDHSTRTHRDHQRLLNLIAVIALLHQHQREIKRTIDGMEYIEASVSDYAVAYRITEPVFKNAYSHIPKDAKELLNIIYAQVQVIASLKGSEWNQVVFTRRQIREWTYWSEFKARGCMGELERMEYVSQLETVRGRNGFKYQLKVSPEEVGGSLGSFTTPEQLKEKTLKYEKTTI